MKHEEKTMTHAFKVVESNSGQVKRFRTDGLEPKTSIFNKLPKEEEERLMQLRRDFIKNKDKKHERI